MGVQITDLLVKKEIELDQLKGRIIAVDASLFLYQFLTTIRQQDGSPLTDSKGNITSHLVGLFSRTTSLMQKGIKLCYVFDGKSPDLKQKELEKRKEIKLEAEKKYRIAVEKKDVEEMKKYAARTVRLTKEMVAEAKELVEALGLPIIQAPGEGEAQAAFMVKNKDAYAVASQDADCFLFGASILIRNISIAGRKKKANKLSYETVKPEIVELHNVLNELGIDNEQLIALGMLVGTDYNGSGIKGIGPKNALKLVKENGKNFEKLFEEVKWKDYFEVSWKTVFELFKNPDVTEKYSLEWKPIDVPALKKMLVDKYEFSEERVDSAIDKIQEELKQKSQKGLGEFC